MNTKSIAIICATVIFIGIFFWPTLYRYDKMKVRGITVPVRINRLTGDTEYFFRGEWIPTKDQLIRKSKTLPRDEKIKVTGKAWLGYNENNNGDHALVGEVYNGSSWTITEMIIEVIAKEKNGEVRWKRKFKEDEIIPPLSVKAIVIDIGYENPPSLEWGIEEIRGYKGD